MASEWPVVAIGNLCDRNIATIQTGPFGSQLHAHEYRPIGTPVIPTEAIGRRRIMDENLPRVDGDVVERLARHRLRVGDILFARRGAQATGSSAIVEKNLEGALCGTGAILMRVCEPDTLDPTYLSFALASPVAMQWLRDHAVGAVMPNLNAEIIRRLEIPLPPLGDQHAIARTLKAFDDKVEVNRKMNATLGAMARALFKSWFVDFDPVRSKASGRAPVAMDAETANLFPRELMESELGLIPRGWTVSTIGDLADIVGGSTPDTKEPSYWDNGIHHWATPKDLSGRSTPVISTTERRVTDQGLRQISSGLLPVGTVLLSSRAPIGYLGVAEVPLAVNQGFIAMKPRPDIPSQFLLRWAESAHDEIVTRANGSTFLEISKSNFRPIQLVRPPNGVLAAFNTLAERIHRQLVANEAHSNSLSRLRDELLPRLMTGALDVGSLAEAESRA